MQAETDDCLCVMRSIKSRNLYARVEDPDTIRLLTCLVRAQGHPLTHQSGNITVSFSSLRGSCLQNG